MKKMLLALLLLVTAQTQAQTKCDWSGYYMKKVNQQQNVFTFQTNMHYDTCIDYNWIVYDYQLKRFDTLEDMRGYTQVQFNVKGKYKVGLKAVNKCTKPWCDTLFYQIIDITVYGKKAKLSYAPSIKDCKTVTFELFNMNDTCINYFYEIWNANEFSSKMTDRQWKEVSDSLLYFTFDWEDKNLVYYSMKSERVLKHEFNDSGRYIIYTYWQNKCTGIDTWAFNKIVVCPKEQTSNVKTIVKNANLKIVGYYDMMGRQVDYMRSNEVYIVLYSNGQRRKVMRHE
jgi:hypothetical protein